MSSSFSNDQVALSRAATTGIATRLESGGSNLQRGKSRDYWKDRYPAGRVPVVLAGERDSGPVESDLGQTDFRLLELDSRFHRKN